MVVLANSIFGVLCVQSGRSGAGRILRRVSALTHKEKKHLNFGTDVSVQVLLSVQDFIEYISVNAAK